MSGFGPDAWQDALRVLQPDDEAPVTVTYRQALKCAAIVDAFAQGHEGYRADAITVGHFLRAAAARAVHGPRVQTRPSLQDAWAHIDAAPWPPPGPPRTQPDS